MKWNSGYLDQLQGHYCLGYKLTLTLKAWLEQAMGGKEFWMHRGLVHQMGICMRSLCPQSAIVQMILARFRRAQK